MSIDIIWVAQKDSSWISNRIRNDKIDIAFTVYPSKDGYNSKVIIRESWYSDAKSRAVRKTGVVYFSNDREAKSIIKTIIDKANLASDAASAKNMIYADLMGASLSSELTDGTGGSYCNVFNIVPVWVGSSTVAPETPSPEFSMTELISTVTTRVEEALDLSKYQPGDPAPAGYIWIGKELTKIGWPS